MKVVFATGHKDLLDFNNRLIESLQGDKIVRAASSNLHALISERVMQYGRKTDGSLIGGGKYSPGYERYRQKKGRQTDFVDLNFTGDMLDRGFNTIPLGKIGWGLGFINDTEYEKYAYNTQRYGQFIQPSQAEIDLSFKDVLTATDNAIRAAR